MRLARVQIVGLLILALILGAAQCVASCAADSCKPSAPPCHRHSAPNHVTAASCTQDFLLPDAHALPHVAPIGFVAVNFEVANPFVVASILAQREFSPPSPSFSSPTILRL
jgi:hypothetical protein